MVGFFPTFVVLLAVTQGVSLFDAIKYVTNPLTLVAFVVAVGGWVYARWLGHVQKTIANAPLEARADLAARALERFQIDTTKLSPQQITKLAQLQLLARQRRFYVVAAVVLILGIVSALIATDALRRVFSLKDPAVKSLTTDDRAPFRSALVGGGGGQPFSTSCDSATALTGFVGMAGVSGDARLFQIGAICGRLHLASSVNQAGLRPIDAGPDSTAGVNGSAQGVPFRVRCPGAELVQDVAVQGMGFSDGGNYVTSVRLRCAKLYADSAGGLVLHADSTLLVGSQPFAQGIANFTCPRNQVLAGLDGRVGAWIDALSLTCVRLQAPPVRRSLFARL